MLNTPQVRQQLENHLTQNQLTPHQFAKKHKLAATTVADWLNGKTRRISPQHTKTLNAILNNNPITINPQHQLIGQITIHLTQLTTDQLQQVQNFINKIKSIPKTPQ